MEIAGFVVAMVSVVVAIVSVVFAAGANRRADTANVRAREALDLQRRIDEREREFRDVSWAAGWSLLVRDDEPPKFDVQNIGLTPAVGVTLVVDLPKRSQSFDLGKIEPRELKSVSVEYSKTGPGGMQFELVRHSGYRLHWSSPLGQVEQLSVPPLQIG